MCGIVGIWSRNRSIDSSAFKRMGDLIVHRGPDHQGIYIDSRFNIGLLNQRLSIMDLNECSNQPVVSKNGRYVMVFNGEIYNYREIRRYLETRGIIFNTEGDSEVLVEIFAHEGKRCLERLNGMFGFAVFDKLNGELFVARDRLGIKPLYYYNSNGLFAFTSDLKAFSECDLVPKVIRHQSIVDFLFYEVIPQPFTIFNNVFKLLPGHCISVDAAGATSIEKYWEIDLHAEKFSESNDLKDQFREILHKSVQRRIQSDAKVGVFLSGGMDSSAIISQMGPDYPAYTIGFKHATNTLDVSRSKLLARKFGLQHNIRIIDIDQLDSFISFIDILDEPISITSMIPLVANYSIAKEDGVRVILSGDGADEILGGYRDFHELARIQSLNGMLRKIAVPGLRFSKTLLSQFRSTSRPGKFRDLYINPWIKLLSMEEDYMRHQYYSSTRDEEMLETMLGRKCGVPVDGVIRDIYKDAQFNLDLLLAGQTLSPLVNRNLAKIDKTSMANSVEARVPFLDHELVEFTFRLPDVYRVRKKILKDSMENILPEEIIHDRKRGFNLPLQSWIHKDILPNIDNYLDDEILNRLGLFPKGAIDSLVSVVRDPRRNHGKMLWNVMVLSRWLRGNNWSVL